MGADKRVRILMGIPSGKIKIGGPVTHLPYLVDYFEKNEKYNFKTFIYGSKLDGGSLIKNENIWYKFINTMQVFILFVYKVIIFNPHIIHINTSFNRKGLLRDIPFSLFSFVFRKRLIFKLHGSSYDLIYTKSKLIKFLIKLFFTGARKVGVLSGIEKEEFIKEFGYSDKMVVVKNIAVQLKPEDYGVDYFIKDPVKTYCLFVSRIIKGKGLDDLIRALPQILKARPYFTLIIAGDGPEKKSCTDLAIKLGVNNSIIWLGIVPNHHLPEIFDNSDLFIFPSYFPEGMPMALVEALRSGIPIITTKVRFAVNYLEEYENCLFINAGDAEDMIEKINFLLDSNDLRLKMKEVNPKKVEEFNQEIVGKEFEAIYSQMLLG